MSVTGVFRQRRAFLLACFPAASTPISANTHLGGSVLWKDTVRWQIDPVDHERKNITLLARLDLENRSFLDFYVLPM